MFQQSLALIDVRSDHERPIIAPLQDLLDTRRGVCGRGAALVDRNLDAGQQIIDMILSRGWIQDQQDVGSVICSEFSAGKDDGSILHISGSFL